MAVDGKATSGPADISTAIVATKRRPSNELLILSASAVVTIFSAGYVITEPAANLAQGYGVIPTPSAVSGRLRDGTYLGEGQSRFGSVFVTVAISGGRITQVWINAVTTTFPAQTIEGLPDEVVSRQSAAVDLVSGASGSSGAFIQAVEAALQQAKA